MSKSHSPSFLNPDHERRIGEIIDEELPGTYVSLSSNVAPEIREFERTSTVVLDVLLKPLLTPYLNALHQRLAGEGVDHTRIMLASGGLASCAGAAVVRSKMNIMPTRSCIKFFTEMTSQI